MAEYDTGRQVKNQGSHLGGRFHHLKARRMTDFHQIGDRLLVVFDGHCGLCNRAVRWFLRRDRRDRLRFVVSDSAKVAEFFARHGTGLPHTEAGPGTILVVRDAGGVTEEILVRSDAVLALLRELPQPWPPVAATLRWVPRPLRDLGYRLIARCRYRIWGRLTSCPLPTAEERARFL
jgi:predicted DCC family thiol-disulfide oxidoreductase YuxK